MCLHQPGLRSLWSITQNVGSEREIVSLAESCECSAKESAQLVEVLQESSHVLLYLHQICSVHRAGPRENLVCWDLNGGEKVYAHTAYVLLFSFSICALFWLLLNCLCYFLNQDFFFLRPFRVKSPMKQFCQGQCCTVGVFITVSIGDEICDPFFFTSQQPGHQTFGREEEGGRQVPVGFQGQEMCSYTLGCLSSLWKVIFLLPPFIKGEKTSRALIWWFFCMTAKLSCSTQTFWQVGAQFSAWLSSGLVQLCWGVACTLYLLN